MTNASNTMERSQKFRALTAALILPCLALMVILLWKGSPDSIWIPMGGGSFLLAEGALMVFFRDQVVGRPSDTGQPVRPVRRIGLIVAVCVAYLLALGIAFLLFRSSKFLMEKPALPAGVLLFSLSILFCVYLRQHAKNIRNGRKM